MVNLTTNEIVYHLITSRNAYRLQSVVPGMNFLNSNDESAVTLEYVNIKLAEEDWSRRKVWKQKAFIEEETNPGIIEK